MGISKYTVTINSDGSVMTYDSFNRLMTEFTGKLPILHKVMKYVDMSNKKDLDDDLKIYDPVYKFCISGVSNKELVIPKEHIHRFIKSIVQLKDGVIDFSAIAEKLGVSEEELNNS